MSLWSRELQPIFNKWEAAMPVDEFCKNERRYPQLHLKILAQDDAEKHAVLLRAALQKLLQHPQPPRRFAQDAGEGNTITPRSAAAETGGTPLRDFDVLVAAIDAVDEEGSA
jgi:hypothetical protein